MGSPNTVDVAVTGTKEFPLGGVGRTPSAGSLQEELLEELDERVELIILVKLFLEAVAFIFGHDVPDGCSALFKSSNDLVAFADGDAGVVLAGNHQHGLLDFCDVVHR